MLSYLYCPVCVFVLLSVLSFTSCHVSPFVSILPCLSCFMCPMFSPAMSVVQSWHVCPVASRLSELVLLRLLCSICPFVSALHCRSCCGLPIFLWCSCIGCPRHHGHVVAVCLGCLSWLSCPCWLHRGCPLLAHHFRHSPVMALVVCSGCHIMITVACDSLPFAPVLAFLSWLSCPGCFAFAALQLQVAEFNIKC
jgi:hypothetical protein